MICDICGREKVTEPATVTMRGETRVLNLCDTDGATLFSMASQGSVGPRRTERPKPTSKPAQHRIEPIA